MLPHSLPPVEGPVEEEVEADRPTFPSHGAAAEAAVGAEGLQPQLLGPLLPPDNEDQPVGARLTNFAPRWSTMFGSVARCTRTLEEGVKLTFKEKPQLTRHPVQFSNHSSLDALRRAVSSLEKKRVIEPVLDTSSPGFHSRLFLVPKRNGELRPVIDLSTLNRLLDVPSFRMETQQSVRAAVRPGEWVTSIDLQDAYLHVPMAPSTYRYLRFRVGSDVYQFRTLPFGLSTSPREFTKILQPVVDILRAHGIRLHAYLDDWLIRGDSAEQVHRDTRLVLNTLRHLGWIVNLKKSSLDPAQDFVYLGMRFRTTGSTVLVSPSEELLTRVAAWEPIMESSLVVTARQLARMMGLVTYLAPLVPRGYHHLRPMQWLTRGLWNQHHGAWSDLVVLPPLFLEMWKWWSSPTVSTGVPASPPGSQVTLCTDASLSGWGAACHCLKLEASGLWSVSESVRHINILELMAVRLAIRQFQTELAGKVVRLLVDNRTVVAYLRCQGGTRSKDLSDLSLEVLREAEDLGIVLRPAYIPGTRNVTADGLSRRGRVLETEWSLSPRVLAPVFSRWGRPTLDLFATPSNKRLPRFVCPFPHPEAEAVDALSLSWNGLGHVYAFPPPRLVPLVLQKLQSSRGIQMTLIASWRTAASWLPELITLAEDKIPLVLMLRMLSQVVLDRGRVMHPNPSSLRLHAWKLSRPAS